MISSNNQHVAKRAAEPSLQNYQPVVILLLLAASGVINGSVRHRRQLTGLSALFQTPRQTDDNTANLVTEQPQTSGAMANFFHFIDDNKRQTTNSSEIIGLFREQQPIPQLTWNNQSIKVLDEPPASKNTLKRQSALFRRQKSKKTRDRKKKLAARRKAIKHSAKYVLPYSNIQKLNPAVREHLEKTAIYVDNYCKKPQPGNNRIPLPPFFDFRAYGNTISPEDELIIDWIYMMLPSYCRNRRNKRFASTEEVTEVTTSEPNEPSRWLSPAIEEYLQELDEYLSFNCNDQKIDNPDFPLPEKFNFNAHCDFFSRRDKNIVEWIYAILHLHCNNPTKAVVSQEVQAYVKKIKNFIASQCEKGQPSNTTVPMPYLFDFEAHQGQLSEIDNRTIEEINANLKLSCNNPFLVQPSHAVREYAQKTGEYIDSYCKKGEPKNPHAPVPPQFKKDRKTLSVPDINAVDLITHARRSRCGENNCKKVFSVFLKNQKKLLINPLFLLQKSQIAWHGRRASSRYFHHQYPRSGKDFPPYYSTLPSKN